MSGAAKIYNETSFLQQEYGLELIELMDEFLTSCNTNHKILDLGCGTGYLASVVAQKVTATVLGVDPDKERVALAQSSYSDFTNLRFIEGSHETFPAEQYDLIFSNIVFHWIKNKDVLFERAYKYLKSGGQFVFCVPSNLASILYAVSHLMGPDEGAAILNSFSFATSDEYMQLAVDNGFAISYYGEKIMRNQWKDIDDLITWWTGVCHGAFDPTAIDPVKLENFKKPYGKQPVNVVHPVFYYFILTKQ